jgi:hypothetical protein
MPPTRLSKNYRCDVSTPSLESRERFARVTAEILSAQLRIPLRPYGDPERSAGGGEGRGEWPVRVFVRSTLDVVYACNKLFIFSSSFIAAVIFISSNGGVIDTPQMHIKNNRRRIAGVHSIHALR